MAKKYAILFPGQGSQSLGMLSELSASESKVKVIFDRASKILGYDLWQLTQAGPLEKLNQTEFTQPALLAADIAVWECWCAKSATTPQVAAGHSLGEYAALVCANALSFEDAIELVAKRGRYMQEAVAKGTGAMAAIIGLENDKINQLCEQAAQGEVLGPANFNSKGQTVVAGHLAAVERAVTQAKTLGAKLAKLIPVSVPSHCQLMQSAADRLQQDLKNISIQTPEIAVLHNYDVKQHSNPEEIREALVRQLTQPVRWVDTIETLIQTGIHQALECGPGKVLTGLNKRISADIVTHVLNRPESLNIAAETIGEKNVVH